MRKLFRNLAILTLIPTGAIAGIPGQGTWETTLLPRDLDNNWSNGAEAFYDTALNITWLRSAHPNTGSWFNFSNWVADLAFGTAIDWRLPATQDSGPPYSTGLYGYGGSGATTGFNVDPSVSELAHLFFVTLGNRSTYDVSGNVNEGSTVGFTNVGNFLGLSGMSLWSETPYALDSNSYWYFKGTEGALGVQSQFSSGIGAVAVHDGDVGVSPVPELPTSSLLLLGFSAFALATRKFRPHGRRAEA